MIGWIIIANKEPFLSLFFWKENKVPADMKKNGIGFAG